MEKRIKVVVGVNTLTSIGHHEYSNHCQMWFRLGRDYPNFDFVMNHPLRQSIDRMRNQTCKIAVDLNADYVLFLDDDVLVDSNNQKWDFLKRLVDADKDIIAGWTIIRGYPFDNMFFKWTDETRVNLRKYNDPVIDENGLIDCDAIGCSLVLIKVELLKKLEAPYFVTGPFNTEDIYFCLKARQNFPETTIFVDSKVQTAHCMGPEYCSPSNVEALKVYTETMNPGISEEVIRALEGKSEEIKNYEDALRVAHDQ